jgi:hypothetical protein
MSDFYTCAMCEGKFLSIWPGEEAKAEYEALFGKPYKADETEALCDTCFWEALTRLSEAEQ